MAFYEFDSNSKKIWRLKIYIIDRQLLVEQFLADRIILLLVE